MEVCRQARDIIYRTSRSSRATYEGGSGYTEKHIIIGTVMAIISYGRLSPSPGFLLFLTPDRTAGQPAGRKRIRMKNRASQLDKVVTSLLRRWANFIFFRKEIGMGGGEKKSSSLRSHGGPFPTNLEIRIQETSINRCWKRNTERAASFSFVRY